MGTFDHEINIALQLLKNKNVDEAKQILHTAAWAGSNEAVKIMLNGYKGKLKSMGFNPDRASEVLYFAIAEQQQMPKYKRILEKIANSKKRNTDNEHLENADAIVLRNAIAFALVDAAENYPDFKCLVITQYEFNNECRINLTITKSFEFDTESQLLWLEREFCYNLGEGYVVFSPNRIKNYPLAKHGEDCKKSFLSFFEEEKDKLFVHYERIYFARDEGCQMLKDNMPDNEFTSAHKKDEVVADVDVKVDVSKAKLMELLQCTQCGNTAIDTSNHVDGFVVCSSCGSKYAFNMGALGPTASIGLNFNEAKMNMPDDASIPEYEFSLCSILNNKLLIIMPKAFSVMDEQTKRQKYPSENRPQLVYTNPEGTVNMAFSLLTQYQMTNEIVADAANQITTLMTSMDRSLKILEKDTLDLNGVTLSYFNFISRAADFDIYNLMFIMPLDGFMLQVALNCLAKDRWYWRAVFDTIARSVAVNQ